MKSKNKPVLGTTISFLFLVGIFATVGLEKEHGKLVYSFDIRNPKGTISGIWVDSKTGKVISSKEETNAA